MGNPDTTSTGRPFYGIDAPGLVWFFVLAGMIALGAAILLAWLFPARPVWVLVFVSVLALISLYLLGMGCLMLFWSGVIKIRGRETMLDRIAWRGDEHVLDIGCGRGLMLVAAARRLTSGKAVGIDIWQSADQSGNTPGAALINAGRERVRDRVDVVTGDMRELPFADASFDVVVSHWAVHNLPSETDRDRALAEIFRVLRPGGRLILADIEHRERYTATLGALGFETIRLVVRPVADAVLRAISFGSFGPATHYATKPR